jgi:dTDP-4-dehydrorhamnose 3,5-epimerase
MRPWCTCAVRRTPPEREHGIHLLDAALGIDWPEDTQPLLSEKDAAAPMLSEAAESGLLPEYGGCLQWYDRLRSDQPAEQVIAAQL